MKSSVLSSTVLLVIFIAVPALSQWDFRVAGFGSTDRKGRLEIKIGTGAWGTVCKDGFNGNDAVVACRSLGIEGGAVFVINSIPLYGNPGNIPILKTTFMCRGNEQTLERCISADATSCTHNEDIGVECLGVINIPTTTVPPDFATLPPITCANNHQRIRLVDGSSATEGRVEINYQNEWGTICDDFWEQNDAKVVCSMLCNSNSNAQAIIRSQFPSAPATTRIWLNGVQCAGTEAQIDQCTHWGWANTTTCTHKKDAGVICAPPGTMPSNPLQPAITCGESTIIAKLNKAQYPGLVIGDINLLNPGTGCTVQKTEDATDIILTIPFVGCNTEKAYNATHINYKNTLIRRIPTTTDIITRESQYTVGVTCEVRRDKIDNSKLDPLMIEAPPVAGNTTFNIQMFVFDPATNQRTALPARLPLGNTVGVGVELVSNDPSLKIVVPECFASPDSTVTAQSKRYALVQDKCRQDNTLTISVINMKEIGLIFKIFMFIDGAVPEQNLYVHCTGIVCGLNEPGDECDQTCNAKRKKRDTTSVRHRYKRGLGVGLAVVEGVEGPFHVVVTTGTKTNVNGGIMRKEEEAKVYIDPSANKPAESTGDEVDKNEKTGDEVEKKKSAKRASSGATQLGVILTQLVTLLMAALITILY